MTVNLVIIREDNKTAWHHELDDDFFPFFFEDLFRLWLEKIRDEEKNESH